MSVMFLFAVTLPPSKRLKYAEVSEAKVASWKHAPSDVMKKEKRELFKNLHEEVPVYYHWFAVVLHDALSSNEVPSDFSSPPESRVKILLEKLTSIKKMQRNENEYSCSSVLALAMQQFFFADEHCEKAACLAQYPVLGTRRPDFSIHTLREYFPFEDILFSDYKISDLEHAISETISYFVNANERKSHFEWAFGLPCTSTHMIFQLYMSANRKVLVINLAEVEIDLSPTFEFFLKILYGAVHWRINNPVRYSKRPLACEPIFGVELRDNFELHPSDRVFYNKKTVYKIYTGDHRKPNSDLMVQLGYFNDVSLLSIGKTHQLLSYTALLGELEPTNLEQIEAVKSIIEELHKQKLVHADIRIGNIIFSPSNNKAFLIDFDFTGAVGSLYHENYNRELDERHPDIKSRKTDKKLFIHDKYALNYIASKYFGESVYPCLS